MFLTRTYRTFVYIHNGTEIMQIDAVRNYMFTFKLIYFKFIYNCV